MFLGRTRLDAEGMEERVGYGCLSLHGPKRPGSLCGWLPSGLIAFWVGWLGTARADGEVPFADGLDAACMVLGRTRLDAEGMEERVGKGCLSLHGPKRVWVPVQPWSPSGGVLFPLIDADEGGRGDTFC